MKSQSLSGKWQFRQVGLKEWSPANVPGGVHTDLLALDLIPDPFVGDNEKRVSWVAESNWEYLCQFDVIPEIFEQSQIWLVCDGLDTLATVSLNEQVLGKTNNMYRQYRWDVKKFLKPEGNIIHITFESPVQYIAEKESIRSMPSVYHAIPGGPHLRKAPSQFGWDWGPKLPPIGIWKDIRLEGASDARLSEVHLRQIHQDNQIKITAALSLERLKDIPLRAKLSVTAPDGEVFEEAASISDRNEATISLPIENPQLWWPNGYGGQPLYQIAVSLFKNDTLLEEKDYQLGLRTIELRQDEDQWGRTFEFVVNGVRIFAKGSDWVPADSFPTRVTDQQLEKLIHDAASTHQNMLRVWGGGFFEEDRFYDLCDRYGILIWQDFIFACSVYPLNDPDFVENLHIEVIENVRRLRHRTSLALWCGNNEMEWGWADWGWNRPELQDLKEAYDRYFHHTLPGWVDDEDPDHAYWPSSPSSGIPFEDPNGQKQGNAHYWDVWHGGKPFTAYRQQYPRFMSEFGFQALPPMDTIRTFADESEWNMTSYIMEQHQKNASGNSLMVKQMLDSFRLPKDFQSMVYLSLVLQAEGIRYGVEHWRRHMDRVAGTLYWQLNDCWPVASWSSLDYFGRWKALHYAARRFYAPVMLSIEDDPPQHGLYVTNDTQTKWQGTIDWTLETLDGNVLTKGTETVKVFPLSTAHIKTIDFERYINEDTWRNLTFTAELWQGAQLISRQAAFFAPTKHLQLANPQIKADCRIAGGQLYLEVESVSLARLVEFSLEGASAASRLGFIESPECA
ncbi:MAG: glycoside hydrolase family 2 protein [Anaerolineales bacterium]